MACRPGPAAIRSAPVRSSILLTVAVTCIAVSRLSCATESTPPPQAKTHPEVQNTAQARATDARPPIDSDLPPAKDFQTVVIVDKESPEKIRAKIRAIEKELDALAKSENHESDEPLPGTIHSYEHVAVAAAPKLRRRNRFKSSAPRYSPKAASRLYPTRKSLEEQRERLQESLHSFVDRDGKPLELELATAPRAGAGALVFPTSTSEKIPLPIENGRPRRKNRGLSKQVHFTPGEER